MGSSWKLSVEGGREEPWEREGEPGCERIMDHTKAVEENETRSRECGRWKIEKVRGCWEAKRNRGEERCHSEK